MFKCRNQQDSAEKAKSEPLVFINSPITSSIDDIIGFSTQVDTICEAIQNGSTMVGLIADYGSGKSSLTGLLSEKVKQSPYRYPNPIVINMWDSLSESDSSSTSDSIPTAAKEVSRLTKSFLYQLSRGKDRFGFFSSYINRRLSKNHGNFSFSVGSIRFWIFFVLAALFYGVYLLGANEIANFSKLLKEGLLLTFLKMVRIFHPLFLVLAGLSLLVGIANTCVVFSHWKNQNVRDIEMNDVFDLYTRIIKHIKPHRKNKKQIIIIEDLDRIEEKSVIVGFMKELYRFQNSLTANSKRFAFVVSVKPEDSLTSKDGQEKLDRRVYSKIFDITIPLKPVHYDDYHSVLLKLIKSDPTKKARLEKLIGTTIDGNILPEAFNWLITGENLTVRDLKDRLNHAIMIMSSRQEYRSTSAVTFEACAAVTYLESQYPKDYGRLIQNEQKFAKLITTSVSIMNSDKSANVIDNLKASFTSNLGSEYSEDFKNDLCSMISSEILNDDFRMYFYTYPSGSHVKTTEERRLCDMLLLPARYTDFDELDTYVDAVYRNGKDNIVTTTLQSLEHYPRVVLMNQTLLNIAGTSDWQKTADIACSSFLAISKDHNCAFGFWSRVNTAEFPEKEQFLQRVIKAICALPDSENILLVRMQILQVYGRNVKDIPSYKSLFSDDQNANVPLVTAKEFTLINDVETAILLINLSLLSPNNFDYISDLICSKKLSGNVLAKAKDIMISYLDLISEGMESIILKFLDINCLVDDRLFHSICTKSNGNHLVSYINKLVVDEITDQYYMDIDTRGIENGLSENILNGLAEKGFYKCILLHAASSENYQLLDREHDNVDHLCESCRWLLKGHLNKFLKIRYHLCIELKDKNYLTPLFDEDFPPISNREYVSFEETSTAIQCINIGQFDNEDFENLLTFISNRTYTPQEGFLLLRQLFDRSFHQRMMASDPDTLAPIADKLNYQSLHVRDLEMEKREIIYALVKPIFERLGLTTTEQMQKLHCFVASAEKELSESQNEYYALISELDELTAFGLQFLSKNYLSIGLSEHLATALKDHDDFENYIIATALRTNDMILEEDIPIEAYLNVYCNVSEMYPIMSSHWDFLEAIQTSQYLAKLYDHAKLITPLYKVPQHSEFFAWMLSSQFTTAEKITYLDTIEKFASEADSYRIQRIICQKENMELMGDKNRYGHIWHLFWKREHKSPYTRAWNQRWSKELGQV